MRGSRGYWLFLLLAVLALLLAACGQVNVPLAEDEVEDQNFGSSLNDYGNDVFVDSSGNVYVTGATRCDYHRSACTAYIRKYDANNKLLWRRPFRISTFGREGDTQATSVSVDANGNAYVMGDYYPGEQGFIRKYSSNGNHLWTQLIDFGYMGGSVRGSAVDNWGNVYVVGTEYAEEAPSWGFVARYSSSGSKLWKQGVGLYDRVEHGWVSHDTEIVAVAVGPKGGLVVVGSYWPEWGRYQDPDPNIDPLRNGFVRKYRPNGSLIFERRFDVGDSYDDNATGVVIDGSGNIYVSGTKSNSSTQGAYLRKFDEWGTQLWRKVTWGSKRSGHGVAVDASGNAYLAGIYRYSGDDYDVFVSKYDASGSKLWTTGKDIRWNPKTAERDVAIATRTGNAIYLIGSTQGKVGNKTYGLSDSYLVRLNGWGKFVWAAD